MDGRPPMNRERVGLTQRLERLERENRRWKLVGVLGLVGVAAVVLMGQAPSGNVGRTIEAERFVLRGTSGETLAVLGVQPDPSLAAAPSLTPVLIFYDRHRRARATVGEKGFGLFDNEGRRRAALAEQLDSPALTFYDREGNERAMLAVGSLSGGPSMTLTDGKMLASLSPRLVGLFAENGTSGGLVRQSDGSLQLDLRDQADNQRAMVGLGADGAPHFALRDKNGSVMDP
jgi:hypothetical protein